MEVRVPSFVELAWRYESEIGLNNYDSFDLK
jgi:hypothetical protein